MPAYVNMKIRVNVHPSSFDLKDDGTWKDRKPRAVKRQEMKALNKNAKIKCSGDYRIGYISML